MKKTYEEIKITEKNNFNKEYVYEHPAFGMIGFYRVSGGDGNLFGSSIKHNDKIVMKVQHGKELRDLSHSSYVGDNVIVEVEMSYSQFAECITAMNKGDGVPCTLRYTEKDKEMPMIANNVSKRKQFIDEFSETIASAMERVQKQIDSIQATIDDKKTLGVKDRQEIVSQLNIVKADIGKNLDFCLEKFNEQMDNTVKEAKGEVEAFCQNKINTIAENALVEHRDNLKKIETPISFME